MVCYYFDDLMKLGDFDFDNILWDEKSYEHILIYDVSQKHWLVQNHMRIRFDKVDVFIRMYDGLHI